ncbi:MAG TPA: PAS domain-containing protein [Albitalea sp.]|uniref:PAS domain-containing sensor histidine kinase n=1 Tax=Piscinibacter sp. TaxID=1903157 RepID=UPI002ED63F6C
MGSNDKALRTDAPGVAVDTKWDSDLLQIALAACELAVWHLDMATGALQASPGLHRLLGFDKPPAAWTLKVLERHVFADDLPAFRAAVARSAEGDEFHCELRLRRHDGRIGSIAMHGRSTDVDLKGRPQRLIALVKDITDRASSDQYLREREAQFSAVFDIGSVGMALVDPATGRFLRVNACLCSLLGYRPGELVGRRLAPLVHPNDRPHDWAELQRLLRGELAALEVEMRMLHRRGGIIWAMLNLHVVRDAAGVPLRLLAAVTDMTERRHVEQTLQVRDEELRQVRRLLEQRVDERTTELAGANAALQIEIEERGEAERQVRELLGSQVEAVEDERSRISRELHDTLGQHLVALALGLKAAQEQPDCAPSVRERIAQVQQVVRRIEDELDRLSYELRPLALDDLGLEEALRSHALAWSSESGVAMDVHTHGLRTGRLTPLVETTVFRVVQEALTNVRKHAGASRVGLIVERRLDELRVVVEDDGCGFDDASVVTAGGRHLGLRSMTERARLVAGQLEIESVPGRGTTVYLVIPVVPDVDEASPEGDDAEASNTLPGRPRWRNR